MYAISHFGAHESTTHQLSPLVLLFVFRGISGIPVHVGWSILVWSEDLRTLAMLLIAFSLHVLLQSKANETKDGKQSSNN